VSEEEDKPLSKEFKDHLFGVLLANVVTLVIMFAVWKFFGLEPVLVWALTSITIRVGEIARFVDQRSMQEIVRLAEDSATAKLAKDLMERRPSA
jgi:hypothetical protein